MQPKVLVGMVTLNKPKSIKQCLDSLLASDHVEDMDIVVVDNGSNEETVKVLHSFEPTIKVVRYDWNIGPVFSTNRWLSMHKPGQHCISISPECVIIDRNWLDTFLEVIEYSDVAIVSARRPTYWIDSGTGRLEQYKERVKTENREGVWVEYPTDNSLTSPLMMYKHTLITHLQYHNEVTQHYFEDYSLRVLCTALKSLIIPDVLIKELDDETIDHPQMGAYESIKTLRGRHWLKYKDLYVKEARVTHGTRFVEGSITDDYYKSLSDSCWEYFKTYEETENA
jgi:glycosyltransferase involved in cell wall biosynthesis